MGIGLLRRNHTKEDNEVQHFDEENPAEFDALDKEDHDSMTVKELKELLDEKGIGYDSSAKKADLIALLED